VTPEHKTCDAVTRPTCDKSDRAQVKQIIRTAFPTLNGDDEGSLAAAAVVAEAAAVGGIVGVRLPDQP
jgi:hypothetical protein